MKTLSWILIILIALTQPAEAGFRWGSGFGQGDLDIGNHSFSAGTVTIGENGTDGQLTIYNELGETDYTNIFNPSESQTASVTYTLPVAAPSVSGYLLACTTAGVLSWADTSTFSTVTVNTEVYDATGWNSDLTVPTKDAVRDKIEAITTTNPFTATANVISPTTSTDNVTVGSTTNLGKLAVDGDTDEVQFLVQGNSTQTSNIFVVEKSDGTDLLTVANDGTIQTAGTGTPAATFGDGTTATYVTTYNLSGTDWTMTAGSNVATFSGNVVVSGNINSTRINPRILSASSYTTDTGSSLNCDTLDRFIVTAQAGALKFNNPTGTPVEGQRLWLSVVGTAARALTYDTQFEASAGAALPTTTVTTARLDMVFVWRADTSKWHCVGTA